MTKRGRSPDHNKKRYRCMPSAIVVEDREVLAAGQPYVYYWKGAMFVLLNVFHHTITSIGVAE